MNSCIVEFENSFDEKIPSDIAHILYECGFDTKTSLLNIDEGTITEIEEFINGNRQILRKTTYDGVGVFKFKPGHKRFILNLSRHITTCMLLNSEKIRENECDSNDFTYILKELIETAKLNSGRDPRGFRYNESIRYYSTFIYLLCGKACYEALSANLPIPQPNTIRKSDKIYVAVNQ